jgi:GTP cyclohydrolase I
MMSKVERIAKQIKDIMLELGMDLDDDSLKDTPHRVAKMWVNELFYGLNPDNFPKMTTVENKFRYDEMLIEANITLHSTCEHHLVPIVGKAHIAYIPKHKILGLSKFNRVVEYFAKRPQVQERLTNDILTCLKDQLDTDDIAVIIDAEHFCVKLRGVKHESCVTRTSALSGKFFDPAVRAELFAAIPSLK